MRLKSMAVAAGGERLTVQTIERAFLHYTAGSKVERCGYDLMEATHLVDLDYIDAASGMNWFECCCCLFLILPAIILYILLDGFVGLKNVGTVQ